MSDNKNQTKQPTDISYLVFDIESIPDVSLIKDVKYPGETLSDTEAVLKFQEEISDITDGRSTFIPVTFQKPISVVVAKVSDDFVLREIVSLDEPNFKPESMTRKFFLGIEDLYPKAALVSFNGRGFDVPLMELMAYRYAIGAKRHFTDKFGTRYRYGSRHIDLQEFLSNFFSIKMAGGLDLLAKLLGRPGKMDASGSDVYQMYLDGKMAEINNYCIHDVLDTYFVFLRSRVLLGKLTSEKEQEVINIAYEYLKSNTDKYPAFVKYLENWKETSPYL